MISAPTACVKTAAKIRTTILIFQCQVHLNLYQIQRTLLEPPEPLSVLQTNSYPHLSRHRTLINTDMRNYNNNHHSMPPAEPGFLVGRSTSWMHISIGRMPVVAGGRRRDSSSTSCYQDKMIDIPVGAILTKSWLVRVYRYRWELESQYYPDG